MNTESHATGVPSTTANNTLITTNRTGVYNTYKLLYIAKLDHGIFFNPYDTLDALIAAYVDKGASVFKPGIFKEKASTPTQSEASDE